MSEIYEHVEQTSNCGGQRVDEMLPPELVEALVEKLTPAPGQGQRVGARRRGGLTAELLGIRKPEEVQDGQG